MGRIATAAVLGLLATLARADGLPPGAGPADVRTGGALRVGVPAGPDPVAGFDRALLAEAGREAGFGVVFDVVPPQAALAGVDAGRIDVAAGPFPPGAAAGRRALAPVATGGDALLKRRGDGTLRQPSDAAGKVLGVIGPDAALARLRAEAAALHARVSARPGAFASDPERDLAAGRIAALAGAVPDVAAAALARPDAFEVMGPAFGDAVRLAPLVRGDRPGLAARLGAAIGRMRADGRLAELQRRWFGIAFDPPDPPSPHPAPAATSNP